MRTIRIGLHSLILAIADIAGIVGGALVAFRVLGVPNQVSLQLPIAVILSTGCFWVWTLSLRRSRLRRLQVGRPRELGACFAASILWAPLVFVPLHYFTQGYLTSIGNLVALGLYQVPVNALALFGVLIFQNSRSAKSPQASGANASPGEQRR